MTATKQAFLILGAESSGTHSVTDLLIAAGCVGHSGTHGDWHIDKTILDNEDNKPWESDQVTDLQPWDQQFPDDQELVVWRVSVPHAGSWIELSQLQKKLQQRGYQVNAVVVIRDQYATLRSQIKWHHAEDFSTATQQFTQALKHIFKQLEACNMDFIVASFEALIHYPQASTLLLEQLGLPVPAQPFVFKDANQKWYQDTTILLQASSHSESAGNADFNERAFPCAVEHTQSYYDHLSLGKERMSQSRVIICGLAYNISHCLPNTLARIEKLGAAFQSHKTVLFENASTDGTHYMLSEWASQNSDYVLLSEPLARPYWKSSTAPERMRYMAECRNHYLDYITTLSEEYDYVIVMDTDLPLGFSYQGVENSFGHNHWDMIGSNGLMIHPAEGLAAGKKLHYDAWAYRSADADPDLDLEKVNTLNFERGQPLRPVNSCFGGIAIYSHSAFVGGARYAGDECEHVTFHASMKKSGFARLFLNPSQLVLYG